MSRPTASLLDAAVTEVRAVSPARAKLLATMGIETVGDLLTTYPNRHIDLTRTETCASATVGQTATVVGTVWEVRAKQPRPRLDILEVTLTDDTGALLGVWFRQPWMARRFEKGARIALSGKVTFDYGMKRMNSPFVEFLGGPGDAPTARFVPVHPATEKLSATWMRRFIANALELAADIPDPLPPDLRLRRELVSKKAALRRIHFPTTREELEEARRRLAYEELLTLQLELLSRRAAETSDAPPTAHVRGPRTAALERALPFELTCGQRSAVADITADMTAPAHMNRMLLGDVGSGKTVVAALAIALAADTPYPPANSPDLAYKTSPGVTDAAPSADTSEFAYKTSSGAAADAPAAGSALCCQSALMAPTEVLAQQHAKSLGPLFDAAGVTWGLLTSSTPRSERSRLLAGAADGSVHVLIGTHALIEDDVVFAHLTLAVIDEQHRFGVAQRAALRAKGPGADLLVMTATPIPRTLALAYYGDLDTSYIRERPAGRPDPVTKVISRDERSVAYDAVRRAVSEGHQAYIICPLVGLTREQRAKRAEDGTLEVALRGGEDISDAKAAASEAEFLAAKVFPGMSVGLLTGHMAASEKQESMARFADGRTDVLVATTVVEVGVDVPNATVMLVEDAERFGLSQLHQLRGRISRSEVAGQFFCVADPAADDDELRARMQAIESTADGFELAEADLIARREGDVLGMRQHGASVLKLANVVDDAPLVQAAHADAQELL